jgi:hypothetical protein
MMGMFPFLFIPGFFVPLAVTLHLVSIQGIVSRLRAAIPVAVSSDCAGPQRVGRLRSGSVT